MLQYLVLLLDDTSVAYCHAGNPLKERNLMPLETLKCGILFGMKQNLMIQYVFPGHALPEEYAPVLGSIDNVKVYPLGKKPRTEPVDEKGAAVEVTDGVPDSVQAKNLVIRLTFSEMLEKKDAVKKLFADGTRVNLCITDVDRFTDGQAEAYKQLLEEWSEALLESYKKGEAPQFNLLTDRMMLKKMHNCDAGVSSITLAPNGKFYLCPAFYYDERMQVSNQMYHRHPSSDRSVGDLDKGLDIPNPQLLKLDHAPLCRECDAFQCRRCIWLNRRLTWDINTPSHQQCVMAHLERNASRRLLEEIRKSLEFMPQIDIPEIGYLDPFDVKRRG